MCDVFFEPGSLVVSCQARPDNPLHGSASMARMARAAVAGGASGIRANGAEDIRAIKAAVDVPIIGINKIGDPSGVYITPTFAAAAAVVDAGADLVAIDGTRRQRPDGTALETQIRHIHRELGVPVMCDIDTLESAVEARAAGADLVATTLAGYTAESDVPDDRPAIDLVRELVAALDCPVVAEGRYWTREQVRAAFDAGASVVVVGTAVTNPAAITRRLIGRGA